VDFHGHGRSEGPRGLVTDPSLLLQDALCAALAYFGDGDVECAVTRPVVKSAASAASVPLFLLGHSMGGGTALVLATLLAHGPDEALLGTLGSLSGFATLRSSFAGAMLLCPVVDMGVSSSVAAFAVATLAYWAPGGSVPVCLMDENASNESVWAGPRYRAYIEADGYPGNPGGLSFGGNIQFRTLRTVLDLSALAIRRLPLVTFPFLVMHDTEGDIVVPGASSKRLVEEAPAESKTHAEVPGGLHDLLANRPVEVTEGLCAWLTSRLG